MSDINEKSAPVKIADLLSAKIHEAFTVASDQLAQRGYITQEQRIPLSSQIGSLLKTFNKELDSDVADTVVDAECADAIANKESNALMDLGKTIYNWLSEKAGARHSGKDQTMLQQVHDNSVELGAACPAMIFKQANGKYRWVTFSSSAFVDSDKEIVSLKAQETDIERMTRDNDYGVLRWWHVGKPVTTKSGGWQSYIAGEGIDLGQCDFSAMEGKVCIESGTFYNDEVGMKFAEHAKELAVSKGFAHPFNQPDNEGVFYDIKTFERSLLPKDRQSNYLAYVPLIRKENTNMDDQKVKKLKELLGEDTTQHVLKQANAAEKAAVEVGLAFKAEDKKKKVAKAGDEGSPEEEATDTEAADEGDMPMMKKGMKELMTQLKEVKEMLGSVVTTKEQQGQEVEALKLALKAAQDGSNKVSEALAEVVKVQGNQGTVLKELLGDLPKSVKGHRASEADDTVVVDPTRLKQMPQQSPINDFMAFATTGQVQPQMPQG